MIEVKDIVKTIFDYLSNHESLQTFDGKAIYFKSDLDLKDIDEEFEKGLPDSPIITVFLKNVEFNPDTYSSFKRYVPDVKIDVVCPNHNRNIAYQKSLEFALLVSEIIDNRSQLDELNENNINDKKFQEFKTFLTKDIERIGGKKFTDKGIYAPQRISLKIEL